MQNSVMMTETPRRRSLRGVPGVFDDKKLHPTFRFWISLGSHPATELPNNTWVNFRERQGSSKMG
jgi:hypothetical protein